MNLVEAARVCKRLAEAFNAGLVTRNRSGGYDISEYELEAITYAAAVLGMFVEAQWQE